MYRQQEGLNVGEPPVLDALENIITHSRVVLHGLQVPYNHRGLSLSHPALFALHCLPSTVLFALMTQARKLI